MKFPNRFPREYFIHASLPPRLPLPEQPDGVGRIDFGGREFRKEGKTEQSDLWKMGRVGQLPVTN